MGVEVAWQMQLALIAEVVVTVSAVVQELSAERPLQVGDGARQPHPACGRVGIHDLQVLAPGPVRHCGYPVGDGGRSSMRPAGPRRGRLRQVQVHADDEPVMGVGRPDEEQPTATAAISASAT